MDTHSELQMILRIRRLEQELSDAKFKLQKARDDINALLGLQDEVNQQGRDAGLQDAISWLYQEGYEEAGFALRQTVNAGNL